MKEIFIKENDANQRVDKFLIKSFPKLSTSEVYKYIRKKRVKLNNKRCEASNKLSVGDVMQLYINDDLLEQEVDLKFLKSNNKLNVIYEDENILIVNKPVGLIVHEDDKEKIDTLVNRVKKYLYLKGNFNPNGENSFVPALVNRIDRNTEGLVVAAKNAQSLRILNEKFKNRELQKFYLCLAQGKFKNKTGILNHYLIKDEAKNKVYVSDEQEKDAKKISTKYRVVEELKNNKNKNLVNSIIEIELLTGRSHQIRAHMAYIGHPLVGDIKYGATKNLHGVSHQILMAYKLVFDFKKDANILNYLNKKVFVIKDAKNKLINIAIM